MQDEIIIKVTKASDEDGYFYDIYASDDKYQADESEDGGFCTTTIENALEMANEQAKAFLFKKHHCRDCGITLQVEEELEDGICLQCDNNN